MNTIAYRASLIRKIEKEMGRLEASGSWTDHEGLNSYFANKQEGQLEALGHVLWLIKDTEDL